MLRFKNDTVARHWKDPQLSEKLRGLVLDVTERRMALLKEDTVVTCIYRTFLENKALNSKSLTHVEWRAVDLRVNEERLKDEMSIRQAICEKYPISAKMPRIPPLDHGTALHYHVQVSRAEAGWQKGSQ